ncbi:MAG: hypothetical protein IJF83_11050 [Methanobrevibacter sp.]|nr:hypothetical protein [Methanobrevibacter sp.]
MSKAYSSTFNMNVIEDDLTTYLEKLENLLKTEKKEMVNTLMREMVGFPYLRGGGYIAPLMSQWNPFLYSTGQDSKYWEGLSSDGITTLEAVYTGMDINSFFGSGLPKGVWSEFATRETKNKDPKNRVLERDYAFYQETGIDEKAKPEQARNKGAIRKGIIEATPHLHRDVVDYVGRLLELKQVKHTHTGRRSVEDMFR